VKGPDFSTHEYWDRRASAWERRANAPTSPDAYGIPTMDALVVQPGERVLDIGCGPGTTAIELAARVGPDGEVVGVDLSPEMAAAASRRAAAAGISNVRFVAADAQTTALGRSFDAAFSRFGVMFFLDPGAAFANIARALRPGGRIAWAIWGPVHDNPWLSVPVAAAAAVLQVEVADAGADRPGPFFLADRERVSGLLREAGFSDVAIGDLAGGRQIGAATADGDIHAMLDEIGPISEAYNAADDWTRRAAVAAVRAAIEPYRNAAGWRLPGAALQVTAHLP
jgi:SAM-dependent methyltransferase